MRNLCSKVENPAARVRGLSHLEEKLQLLIHLLRCHAGAPAEVDECLPDGEFAVQCDLLRHVADSGSGHARSFGSWSTSQDPDLAGIQTSATDDARQ